MLTLIAAAAATAAQPAAPAQPMPMGQMQGTDMKQMDHKKMGQMSGMKDCCCKDMMSKEHDGHGERCGSAE